MNPIDRSVGCLVGLAVGDAVGTTLEFKTRGTFEPIVDMVGGGPFGLKKGQWTDDTSMALCLAQSLINTQTFDPVDQMERYVRWYRDGYMSSTGECFDIGNTTVGSLLRFEQFNTPYAVSTNPKAAGNGSIMRLAPVPIFYFPNKKLMQYYAGESSRTTHGAKTCVDACRLMAAILYHLLSGQSKEEALLAHMDGDEFGTYETEILAISQGHYMVKNRNEICGSGYVVESLEAALWCFYNTDTFSDAILAAANLGDDADTTAAICGQFAGAYYGIDGIPADWIDAITHREMIVTMARDLHGTGGRYV
jgi:ADP-ribosyl-[dinitrogen reductase] hydrolase